mmetsp:Transcript_79581/g.157645  ORF Transcript_79581/g.157645 Transcript_79581/m.157645 type:complete len:225 (-) Transcript_79581:23-697(-)
MILFQSSNVCSPEMISCSAKPASAIADHSLTFSIISLCTTAKALATHETKAFIRSPSNVDETAVAFTAASTLASVDKFEATSPLRSEMTEHNLNIIFRSSSVTSSALHARSREIGCVSVRKRTAAPSCCCKNSDKRLGKRTVAVTDSRLTDVTRQATSAFSRSTCRRLSAISVTQLPTAMDAASVLPFCNRRRLPTDWRTVGWARRFSGVATPNSSAGIYTLAG